MKDQLNVLKASLDGDLYDDQTMKALYATDASAYRVFPLAVTIPKNKLDLCKIIEFASKK